MKPEQVERIIRAGISLILFVAFYAGMSAATASSFHTDLRVFLFG